ncbi:GAF domain-containing protein [Neosynechococcus sphagnicola]|uniref:GAF domain-containing protein n=1 Tax=Neosynechococcus sphagnicola TaxID=1501145 RepID=UPI0012E05461|nr:GAF domain-containing protein [Neosynechococcus sphagnicola]
MGQVNLKRLIKKELSPLLDPLLRAMESSVGIYDIEGTLLLGSAIGSANEIYPVQGVDEAIGWVKGDGKAAVLAQVLSLLVAQSLEKKSLATEVLDRYREVNLLYSIAEKLTTCREVKAVAQLALEEAQRLIHATGAALMLTCAQSKQLEMLLYLGSQSDYPAAIPLGKGIVGYVAQTGKAEIVNDVWKDPRYQGQEWPQRSLMCAPLKAQDRIIGVIIIFNAERVDYTAADLKLLTAIALQSTPAIEGAIFHEAKMEAARQREEKLKDQLNQLRIEIDEAKRARQVAEITDTDFFQALQQKARLQRDRQNQP